MFHDELAVHGSNTGCRRSTLTERALFQKLRERFPYIDLGLIDVSHTGFFVVRIVAMDGVMARSDVFTAYALTA